MNIWQPSGSSGGFIQARCVVCPRTIPNGPPREAIQLAVVALPIGLISNRFMWVLAWDQKMCGQWAWPAPIPKCQIIRTSRTTHVSAHVIYALQTICLIFKWPFDRCCICLMFSAVTYWNRHCQCGFVRISAPEFIFVGFKTIYGDIKIQSFQ